MTDSQSSRFCSWCGALVSTVRAEAASPPLVTVLRRHGGELGICPGSGSVGGEAGNYLDPARRPAAPPMNDETRSAYAAAHWEQMGKPIRKLTPAVNAAIAERVAANAGADPFEGLV